MWEWKIEAEKPKETLSSFGRLTNGFHERLTTCIAWMLRFIVSGDDNEIICTLP